MHNLPAQLTPFVGRDRELTALRRRVLGERLLTLVGPGGVGKTRLALALAAVVKRQFPDAVWLIELSPHKEPEILARTIAQTMGIAEDGRTDALSQLVALLGRQRVLLILDNCENVVQEVAALTDRLLQSCPQLTVLATSRERLGVPGELVWDVKPMDLPEVGRRYAAEDLAEIPAIALFLDRARHSSRDFEFNSAIAATVSELVLKLEGLPLAIELAAAWCGILSPEDLLARLSDKFDVLRTRHRTMPSRHSSLQTVIDSSYENLTTKERRLFRHLGLFVGGWNLRAMESVCQLADDDGYNLVARLVDRSLVTVQLAAGGVTRYHMLGMLREYAVEKLREHGEQDRATQAFCTYFLGLAEEAKEHIYRPVGATRMAALDMERDNCRAALEMSLAGDPAIAIRLAAALAPYWDFRGLYSEGRLRLTMAIQAAPTPSPALLSALRGLALMAWAQGDQRFATRQARRAFAAATRLGDADGMVRALQQLAQIRFAVGDLKTARARLEQALPIARGLSNPDALGLCLFRLGLIAMAELRWGEAEQLLDESVRLGRQADDSERLSVGLNFLGRVYLETARIEQADVALHESLTVAQHHGSPRQIARILESMAALAAERGQHERAAWLTGATAGLLEQAGVKVAQPLDRDLVERVHRSIAARGTSRTVAAGREAGLEAAVRYALRVKGGSPVSRAPDRAAAAGLTRRQLTVAKLVAEGLTDRQIAARLFISERTAEGHVEQLRNKLGFSSRAQIAAWVGQNLPSRESDSA